MNAISPEKKHDYKKCSKEHVNSIKAKACWVCGEDFEQPQFKQKTQTTVTIAPSVPSNYKDYNYAEAECARYVPGRTRCDDKDPSGVHCIFITMNCAIREKRFHVKPSLDAGN